MFDSESGVLSCGTEWQRTVLLVIKTTHECGTGISSRSATQFLRIVQYKCIYLELRVAMRIWCRIDRLW